MLAHQVINNSDARATFLFLHGILGSGANWRTFARRLCAARPGLCGVLCDLRLHGASQEGFSPPHTLAAAADDVLAVAASLPLPVVGVLGHSFGGKVALALLREAPPTLRELWVIDSTPAARPEGRGSEATLRVLRSLAEVGPRHARREDFIAAIVARGHGLPVAQWLAMNLRPAPEGGYRLVTDLAGIGALLDDYFAEDYWPLLSPPPAGVAVHLVAGGRSEVMTDADRRRAAALPGVSLSVLPRAGHDIHVDDPEGLLGLMTETVVVADGKSE